MAHITADRVRDTSTSTGTGNFTVSGTAPTGFRTLSAVLSAADTFYYVIQGQASSEWEVGFGTYSSANVFARTTVLSSSNSGSVVTFSAGTKDVFLTLAASKTVQLDNSGNLGIGTSSPAQYSSTIATLDIEKSGGAGIKFGNGTAKFGVYYDNSSNASLVQTFSSSPISFAVNNTVVGQFDTSNNFNFNSGYGSSAVAYGCRAWVNFNGQGTVAIRGSGNVSSITDNGVGRYRVNFSTSLVDANYAINGTSRETVTNGVCIIVDVGDSGSRNTSGFDIQTIGSSAFTLYDSAYNNVSVFR